MEKYDGSDALKPFDPELFEAIATYEPENDDWSRLDRLVQQLWETEPTQAIDALFRVLERFPDHDGYGVFWTILHGLESLPDYEAALLQSIDRQPTEFNALMVLRILNTNQSAIHGIDLIALLEATARHPRCSPELQASIHQWLDQSIKNRQPP